MPLIPLAHSLSPLAYPYAVLRIFLRPPNPYFMQLQGKLICRGSIFTQAFIW